MAVRHTALLALTALAFTACATAPAPVGAENPEARVSRVVVAPLNLAVRGPAELDGKGEPVWRELLDRFQTLDRHVSVLSPISAERLWMSATSGLDMTDRESALRAARSRFAQRIAAHHDYDVLVVPSLVLRPAEMHGRLAFWDGVQRFVPGAWEMTRPVGLDVTYPAVSWESSLHGKVAGASLHVAVLRSDGTPVHEGIGGLDLIQEAHREDGEWGFALRQEPFADSAHLREGVERAFDHPLRSANSGG